MKKSKIILVGGGGHCRACIDVIECQDKFEIYGIIDKPEFLGHKVLGYPIIGDDKDLPDLAKKGYSFLISLGFHGKSSLRQNLYELIEINGGHFPTIVSPLAYVSKHNKIGKGNIIMHHVLLNSNISIGDNNIINSKALLEHDSKVGHHNHISTQAVLNGSSEILNSCFLGSSSVISNNVKLCSNVIVGAGAVVLKDIDKQGKYLGIPAKRKEI